MLVILIGSREFALVLLGIVAIWKDGVQLRFWGAYFIVRLFQDFQDGVGALKYETQDTFKWVAGVLFIILAIVDAVCFYILHSKFSREEDIEEEEVVEIVQVN